MRAGQFLTAVFALSVAPVVATAQQYQGFCGNYVQIASNGDPCPDCALQIADNPEIRKYFAHSEGWSAELDWRDASASAAVGTVEYEGDAGADYQIEMEAQGFLLKLWMQPRSEDEDWLIAIYACLD